MARYTDDDIRSMKKVTAKIAADYLGISPMAVTIGMRNSLLPIGFAVHNQERDRIEEGFLKAGAMQSFQKGLLHTNMDGSMRFRFKISKAASRK